MTAPLPRTAQAITLDAMDQTVLSGAVLSVQGSPTDITSHFNTDFAAPINGQETSTVVIPVEPVVQFVPTPEDGDGISLPATTASSDSVEMSLDIDEYVKLPVDRKSVKATTTLTRLGTAVGKALVRLGNKHLAAEAVANAGVTVAVGASITDQKLWSAFNGQAAQFSEAGYDLSEFELLIRATTWSTLNDNIANLRGSVDALSTAARILGVSAVTFVSFDDANVLGVLAHKNAIAVAKRLDPTRLREGDKSDYIITRVLLGAKVLVADAVAKFVKTAS